MKVTVSLKGNRQFRRMYSKGKSGADSLLAVYCRKNGRAINRLGITVGKKVGCAVKRNLLRRRIKEAYRINEDMLACGYDIVVVGRVRAGFSDFWSIEKSLMTLLKAVGALK